MSCLFCHTDRGAKAFKGKGAAREGLRQCEGVLEGVRQEMVEMSKKTRAIQGRTFYLELHKSKDSSGQERFRLVWRLAAGRNGHTTWRVVREMLTQVPVATARYYEEVQQRVLELNALEQIQRFSVQTLQKLQNAVEDGAGGSVTPGDSKGMSPKPQSESTVSPLGTSLTQFRGNEGSR